MIILWPWKAEKVIQMCIIVFLKNGLKDFNEVWINKIEKKMFLTK